ncbi:hypothetical protein EAG11_02890 [Flavobacterium sp. 140616W15]|nr:hypothetical protein EAG11_02890 [Flavobacterium sp. 140616W15]
MIFSCLNGYLSFGNGLGDLYYLVFSAVVFFITLIVYFYGKSMQNRTNSNMIFGIVLIIITMIILILKLTVLRGAEN